jgi:hypothetical protein
MDSMVLCRCGHSSTLHTNKGCRAGRFQACGCLLDAASALQLAIDAVRVGGAKTAEVKPAAAQHK